MRRLLLLLVVGSFLVGCGASSTVDTAVDGPGAGTAGPVPSEPAGADGSPRGPTTPFGTVTLVDGAKVDGAVYAGDDLALWFWAPW